MYIAIRDAILVFNPASRDLHRFIYRTKYVAGYPGLGVNCAFPFLLCTPLRDDRLSFLYIFNCGNQHFRLDLWMKILQSLMKPSLFFWLTDVAGPAVFATQKKFSFCCPRPAAAEHMEKTWELEPLLCCAKSSPDSQVLLPDLHMHQWPAGTYTVPHPAHKPVGTTQLSRRELRTHQLNNPPLPPATWESTASPHTRDPLPPSENPACRCDHKLLI